MGIFLNGRLFVCGLSEKSFIILTVAIVVLWVADKFKFKGISIRDWVLEKPIVIQWCLILGSILVILLFGIYGNQTNSFIYSVF